MKLIKGLFFIFALTFTAILLTSCSANAEDINKVAEKAFKALDEAKGVKRTLSASIKGKNDDGKDISGRISSSISSSDESGEMSYTLRVNLKEDGKKYVVKESGSLIKTEDAFKLYIKHKENIDGDKEEHKRLYKVNNSSSVYLYANEYLSSTLIIALMVNIELQSYISLTQETIDNGDSNQKYSVSSLLGFYKVVDEENKDSENSKITLRFNEKGTVYATIKNESNDEKIKAHFYMRCKDVKIKTPSGDYKEE